ncbi:methyl-accepting chemotaxis protein [Pseudorhodoferax sp.]|uniref:methyl-accepting chemotaxis protein n=1 Tax=Pseudorhodoferax sp. TaxID=1993553 RepID=UPI002DD67D87|nr:methyl-accepting chemotaxis protein [Pseudorhodoferax sp.]
MTLSIKQLFLVALAAIGAALALAVLCIVQLGRAADTQSQAHGARYASYMLADELRQSSDDLTRLARTYVVSGGDARWEQQYLEVLDIRNGKRPRPAQYEKIYWDFRAAGQSPAGGTGPAVPLAELMRQTGFTEAEFAKLREAEANSNDLVRTETVAMNLVKGLHPDGAGGTRQGEPDLARARELMHNADYHAFKARIMQPVNEFLLMLDARTAEAVAQAEAQRAHWFMLLAAACTLLLVVLAGMLLYVYRQVRGSLAQAVAASGEMAQGNLAAVIPQRGVAEVVTLLQALARMRDNLVQVVGSVRQNAESVAMASAQISQGNNDLSSRTEQQASSLEQSAASMDQLSATVRQNADRAVQANQLSMSASTVAGEGGAAVGRLIETMKGINDSSRRIADIIGTIDGIAFQTNILALNAAVEAARAGEQGRGFAVVAGEVRALAQRSAEAAKEIKALISGSVAQVEQGSAQVGRAGTTMDEVVTAIRRVTEIMGEISQASREQADGVSQVSTAVSQMDQATQQNAALVEESAAAAESLKHQAVALVDAVAVFQLGTDAAPSRRVAPENTVPALAAPGLPRLG